MNRLSSSSPRSEGGELAPFEKLLFHLGTDLGTGRSAYLRAPYLLMPSQIVGGTRMGKSTLIAGCLFQPLAERPDVIPVVIDSKDGGLFEECVNVVIRRNLEHRTVLLDLASDSFPGYDLLHQRNIGLDEMLIALYARDAVLAGFAQQGVEMTPQLGRFMLHAFTAAIVARMGFMEAIEILQPDSPVRAAVLPLLEPLPKFRVAYRDLAGLDAMTVRQQIEAEGVKSAVARLQEIVAEPRLNRLFTLQAPALDLAALLRERRILLVNLAKWTGLAPGHTPMAGRLLVNGLLAAAFARPRSERVPVVAFLDEAQDFVSDHLCDAISQGAGAGFSAVLSHHYATQLELAYGSRRLMDAVQNNCHTKFVFRVSDPAEAEEHGQRALLSRGYYDPRRVTDPAMARASTMRGRTDGMDYGLSYPLQVGVQLGANKTWGNDKIHTSGKNWNNAKGAVSGTVVGAGDVAGSGASYDPATGAAVLTENESRTANRSEIALATEVASRGGNEQDGTTKREGGGLTAALTVTRGVTPSIAVRAGTTENQTLEPLAPDAARHLAGQAHFLQQQAEFHYYTPTGFCLRVRGRWYAPEEIAPERRAEAMRALLPPLAAPAALPPASTVPCVSSAPIVRLPKTEPPRRPTHRTPKPRA